MGTPLGLKYIPYTYMVVSLNKGPPYRPQYTTVLIMGTPTKVPLILGNPHMDPLGQGLGFKIPRVGGTCRGGCRGSIQVMRV